MAAVANPPESLPATPTHDASKVLSLYSDFYTPNAVGISSFTNINGATISGSQLSVLGDNMIYLEKALNPWSFINFDKSVDIDEYDALYADIYVVESETPVKVMFKGSDNVNTYNFVVATLQEGWNKVEIKLDDFRTPTEGKVAPNFKDVVKIGFINNKGTQRSLYIDNLYVYREEITDPNPSDPDAPKNLPAAPTHEASKVLSLYSDFYAPDAVGISSFTDINGTKIAGSETTILGEKMIYMDKVLNAWSFVNFDKSVDIDGYDALYADIFVVGEEFPLKVMFKGSDNVNTYNFEVLTLQTGWNKVEIKLDDYRTPAEGKVAPNFKDVVKIGFMNSKGYVRSIYVHNLYVANGKGAQPIDPNLPTVAAPVPDRKAEDVVSLFSDTYENVTTLTQSNPGSPAATMDVVTQVEGDNLLRFSSLNWTLIKIDPVIDLSDMDYLHYDVWVPSGTPRLIYGLSDGTAEGRVPEYKIEKSGTWVSVDVPLNAFKDTQDQEKQGPLTGLKQLRIFSASGYAVDRLYYDNIYAFKGESADSYTYEIESAYEPIMAPETVKPIYTEKSVYKNITDLALAAVDGTTEFKFRKLRAGDESVMRMFSLDKAVVTALTPINVDDMEYIHFNIYKNVDIADASLKIGFQAVGSENVYYADEVLELKDKDWIYYNISIDALKRAGLDCTAIGNIVFEGKGNLYVDNIFAFKGEYTLGLGEEGKVSVDWEAAAEGDVLPDIDTPLIGVNLASACGGSVHGKIGTEYFYPSFKDLYYFKSKGVRLFRFPFRWERIQHELNGELDFESDILEMKKVIAEAERLGMYVMIDMHNYCRYTINGTKHTLGEGVLTQEHMADVWKKLATEFKDYKNIWGYDIQNEPYGLQKGVWLNAAQAIINAIREVDTKTAIVVEGESYASSSTWPTTGGHLIDLVDPADNLIFQAHCYFDLDKSGLYKYGDYDKEVRSSNQHISRLKPYVDWLKTNNKRGILGEFGVPRNDVRWLIMLDEVLAYLKENGVSGTYWVAGTGYDNDHVSVQPKNLNKDNVTSYFEPAQMRILQEYFPVSEETDIQSVNGKDNVISIYPNPVLNNINISSEFGIERIQIFNMSGNLVKESVLGGVNQTNVNVENLTSGIYMVHVLCSNGNVETQKMVKL